QAARERREHRLARLLREVDTAVPQPVLAPRADREVAAVGLLLVQRVELRGVGLEVLLLRRDRRRALLRLRRAREQREHELAAQALAVGLEVPPPRTPLLGDQVVVADVAGERVRGAPRQRVPRLLPRARLRVLGRQV